MSSVQPLSNLQQELLKLYASDVSEEDLLHIKRYLAQYFAFKTIAEGEDRGSVDKAMKQWQDEENVAGEEGEDEEWVGL